MAAEIQRLTDTDAVAWRLETGLSYVPSPLLYDGKLYFLERFQSMFSCYDLTSGRLHYTKQRIEGLGNTYASLVAAGGLQDLLLAVRDEQETVRTPIYGDADVDSFGGVALLNRVGEVEEITEAVVHLATAKFTTGIIMPVDGGYMGGRP